MIKLGVNIDHIATIRQARKESFPSVLEAAKVCKKAGADGITIHLREDRRHIQDQDVYDVKNKADIKLNLEMAAAEEIVKIALDVKPDDVCIVPEKRQELTTEGGLDVARQKEYLKGVVSRLKGAGIKVSLFVDPEEKQILASKEVGADCVELHTGAYAELFKTGGYGKELERLSNAGKIALESGLVLNAGHGLDYDNVAPITEINGMNELNIGFSIIAKAVFTGLDKAVADMKKLINE